MSITLVTGEDSFLMESAAFELAKSTLSDEIVVCCGIDQYEKTSAPDIFANKRRTFVILNAESVPNHLTDEIDSLIMVARENKELTTKVLNVKTLHVPKLKVSPYRNEVLDWILKEGRNYNIDLSRVASALFVNSGNRLRKISSEIRKISETSDTREITFDKIREICVFSADLTPKDIIDSINAGRTNAAVGYYDRLQEDNKETGWIIAFMQSHLLQIAKYRALKAKGLDDDKISESLQINKYVCEKFISPVAFLWSDESLKESIKITLDLDIKHKTGKGCVEYLLLQEIIRLSEEAKNAIERAR
jgi:DNA polymerase III delta subunit